MKSIAQAAADLDSRATTARALVESCLERIEAPDGEGPRTFIRVYATEARASADAMDLLRKAGRAPTPFAGIPISLKDLFDVAGDPTPAGSAILAHAAPATAHAPVVQRLLAAGFIPMGRTNMTEFAFSGIGINPHYGTPRSPWQRPKDDTANGHVPGGSSSGAAVSVADGMAFMGLGTDTGGSCRIPAAFNGIVGCKPTARRVPITGVLPLSPSLDSVGPLARTVQCCATVDAILANETPAPIPKIALRGLRLAVPGNMVMDGMDPSTTEAFSRALNRLDNMGVRITHLTFPEFEQVVAANAHGGLPAAEAFAWHQSLLVAKGDGYDPLVAKGDGYDPRVRSRIERGRTMTAADLIAVTQERARLIASFNHATAAYDAVAMPTSPIAPPTIASLANDADFTRVNALVLRNCALGNFLDRCAISIPCHRQGDAPAGFMLMGDTNADAHLFALANAIEPVLKD
jgi:aspartyl-tRNA(Asn)/glutamyl-tRNA(Gln) amidotransferase subunit A